MVILVLIGLAENFVLCLCTMVAGEIIVSGVPRLPLKVRFPEYHSTDTEVGSTVSVVQTLSAEISLPLGPMVVPQRNPLYQSMYIST